MPSSNQPNSLSQQDQEALAQASRLLAWLQDPAYSQDFLPFLNNLAQQGWPDPDKEYSSNDKLLLDYTRKVGEASAIKKILAFFNDQTSVAQKISNKLKTNEAFKI